MELKELNSLLPPELKKANVVCCAFWKNISGQYVNATGLFIGKILVVSYAYNGMRSKDAIDETYVVNSTIPGIKPKLGKYATEEECREKCIQVAKHFLTMLSNCS